MPKTTPKNLLTSWHVATAAEAIAAAQFARLGFDISVQYGANQPEYDLMIADGERILKISVKGSADGGWGLSHTQLGGLRRAGHEGPSNYHRAVDVWLARFKPRTALCFVQFKDVRAKIEAMPNVYLARPSEVADLLKKASGGRGDTILWENYTRGPRAWGQVLLSAFPTTGDCGREIG